MGVLTLAAARAGKGRMDRGGGLGHRGGLIGRPGIPLAVKSIGLSTWRPWMRYRIEEEDDPQEFVAGGLAGLMDGMDCF